MGFYLLPFMTLFCENALPTLPILRQRIVPHNWSYCACVFKIFAELGDPDEARPGKVTTLG